MGKYAAIARMVNRRQLRAIRLALGRDPIVEPEPYVPDPALLELVDDPYETIPDVRDGLTELEAELRDRSDRRSVFLTIYTSMTRAVENRVQNDGFVDPDWVADYTVAFANYYRRAFRAFESGEPEDLADPWRIAFCTAIGGKALIAQDAFLGVNAHINYDLALTLRDIGIDPGRPRKYDDHREINDILARLIDAQQRALVDLYAPGLTDVDAVLGRFDEELSLFTLVQGREQAWRIAVVLSDFGGWPVDPAGRWMLRTSATGGARFILAPTIDPKLAEALERIERDRLDLDTALDEIKDRLHAVESEQ